MSTFKESFQNATASLSQSVKNTASTVASGVATGASGVVSAVRSGTSTATDKITDSTLEQGIHILKLAKEKLERENLNTSVCITLDAQIFKLSLTLNTDPAATPLATVLAETLTNYDVDMVTDSNIVQIENTSSPDNVLSNEDHVNMVTFLKNQ